MEYTGELEAIAKLLSQHFGMSAAEAAAVISGRRDFHDGVLEIYSNSQVAPVALLCQSCETKSPGDARFCIGCGRQIVEANTGETTRL